MCIFGCLVSLSLGFIIGLIAMSIFASNAYNRGYRDGQQTFEDDMK